MPKPKASDSTEPRRSRKKGNPVPDRGPKGAILLPYFSRNFSLLGLPYPCPSQKRRYRPCKSVVRQQIPDGRIVGPGPCMPGLKTESLPTLEGFLSSVPWEPLLPPSITPWSLMPMPRTLLGGALDLVYPSHTTSKYQTPSTPTSPSLQELSWHGRLAAGETWPPPC